MDESGRLTGSSGHRYRESSSPKSKSFRVWRCAAVVLAFATLALLVTVIVLAVRNKSLMVLNEELGMEKELLEKEQEMLKPPPTTKATPVADPTVFSGLLKSQYKDIADALLANSALNLTRGENATTQDNYIYLIEDYMAPKDMVLDYLNNGKPQPSKYGLVTLFMGRKNPPVVAEHLIDVQRQNLKFLRKHSWNSKPVDGIEEKKLRNFIDVALSSIDYIVLESYNISLKKDCGSHCSEVFVFPRAQPNDNSRYLYLATYGGPSRYPFTYFYRSNFVVVTKENITDRSLSIFKIYYNGNSFSKVEDFKKAYDGNSIDKIKISVKSEDYKNRFDSPLTRGKNPNPEGNRIPFQVYPDGQRFKVNGQHVSYLGWSFDINIPSVRAMQLYNIRYNSQSIAYQLGLQDIMVIYGGPAPEDLYKSFWDASWRIGALANSLIRGVDCPQNAHYIDALHYEPVEDGESQTINGTICIFEHLNSVPLRRHHNPHFAFGLSDAVLIVRQIATVGNYDYIVDYEFHSNGVIEARASSTGYVQTTPMMKNYQHTGYMLDRDTYSVGNMHTHIFNFKIDMDILGRENQFAKIHFLPKTTTNSLDPSLTLGTMTFRQDIMKDETEAAVDYNFDKPTQYILRNPKEKNAQQNIKGYKISTSEFVKIVLPENDTKLNGAEWAKKQMYVTKYHDRERTTATMFTMGNPFSPVVDFKDFANGEYIDGEDLVLWATVGMQHIPVAEDIPVTTTPGKQLSVMIAPFNFFDEDPSIASPSGVLIYDDIDYMSRKLKKDKDICYKQPANPFIRK